VPARPLLDTLLDALLDSAVDNEYCIIHLPARTLATTETFVSQAEVADQIPILMDKMYSWVKSSGVMPVGKNIVIYDQAKNDGMRVRVGFSVSESFSNSEPITCTEFEAATAAHVRHVGPYSFLPSVHTGLNSWCIDLSLQRCDLSWEEYSDWDDNESKLVTDVYLKILD
jgi:effector-binding domain-containing protein